MKNKYKQILEIAFAGAIGAGLAGAYIGSKIQKSIEKSKQTDMDCTGIEDPIRRFECVIKVINSTISTLKDAREECEDTPDPANCKLQLVKKIDKLYTKKMRLQKHVNLLRRSKIIDNQKS